MVAKRQIRNRLPVAELSKTAANKVTTYRSTRRAIPTMAAICFEVAFFFSFDFFSMIVPNPFFRCDNHIILLIGLQEVCEDSVKNEGGKHDLV